MPAQEYSAPAWGQSAYQDITIPSGGLILCKRLDFQDVIAAGLMDEFDQLGPEVEENVVGPAKGRKKPADRPTKKLTKAQQAKKDAADMRAALGNKGDMANLAKLMSLILPLVIKKPVVNSTFTQGDDGKWTPIEPEDRDQALTYVDSIPLPDQMFILEWCMEGIKMSDFKSVREESEPAVGSVDDVPVATDPPEPAV